MDKDAEREDSCELNMSPDRVLITCTDRGSLCFWPPESEKVW